MVAYAHEIPSIDTDYDMMCRALCNILLRPSLENDVCCQFSRCVGGYQYLLSMPGLSGGWAEQAWAGEIRTTKGEAKNAAAVYAYEAFAADPRMGPLILGEEAGDAMYALFMRPCMASERRNMS